MLYLKDHDEGHEDERRPYDYRESILEWDEDMYRVSLTLRGCSTYAKSCSFMIPAKAHSIVLYNGVFCSISRCRKGGLIGSMINRKKRNTGMSNTRRCTAMTDGNQSGGDPWPWSISLTRHPYRWDQDASKINPLWTEPSC